MSRIKKWIKSKKWLFNILIGVRDSVLLIYYHFSDLVMDMKYTLKGRRLSRGGYTYEIMMLAHFLEKGMSYQNLRPFGQRHVKNIMFMLERFKQDECQSFEYRLGLSALKKWYDMFVQHGWVSEPLLEVVSDFLYDKEIISVPIGVKSIDNTSKMTPSESLHDCVMLSRHSVRDFTDQPITHNDLVFPLECFCATPSACNRQLCKLYRVNSSLARNHLLKAVPGIGGLNKETLTFFVITYDNTGIVGAKERNQGYLNAGLATMNFVNGLHYSGLGSCILQWDKSPKAEKEANRIIGIPDNERISVVIAAGHRKSNYVTPISARKPVDVLFKEL